MKKKDIQKIIDNIDNNYIEEAANYNVNKVKNIGIKNLFFKAPLAATIVILLLIGTIAYTAANRTNWSSSVQFDDGSTAQIIENAMFKEIPYDAPKTEEHGSMLPMTHAKVEAILGFDILCYENAENPTVNYDTSLNKDGTIARVDLWWPGIVSDATEDRKSIDQSVYMLNVGAEEGYILPFIEGIDAMGKKVLLDEIHIEELNVDAVCYTAGDSAERITVTFVYDDVMYNFTGNGYTLDEIIEVIKELK